MKIVNSYELRVKSNKRDILHTTQNIFKSLNLKSLNLFFLSAFLLFCFSALSAQPLPPAINPYEYAEEDIFLTSIGIRDRYESDDCAEARAFISRFNNTSTEEVEQEQYDYLRAISFFQCYESYTFFENIIWNSAVESDRCQAIMFLARMKNPDYLPTILEYAKNRNLSIHEKVAIATALMIYGIYDTQPPLVEKAVSILDEICYDAPVDILANCILNYFNLGDSTAIRFFYGQLQKEEYTLYAAYFLAQLGEYKQTFPIFAAALDSNDEYEVHTAIMGLAAINTEEATELIINLPPEKNRLTVRERLINFNPKDIKKGN
jgi:hypothetical protein